MIGAQCDRAAVGGKEIRAEWVSQIQDKASRIKPKLCIDYNLNALTYSHTHSHTFVVQRVNANVAKLWKIL